MKNLIAVVLAAALLLGVGAGVSYAYLTAQDDAANQFEAASVDVDIQEDFDPPDEVKPGMAIPKSPRVYSSSDVDCYVRAMVHFSSSDAQKCCEPLAINEGWSDGGDGYYYWENPLPPGESTGTLFDSVTIRQDAEEEIPPFEILVYAEAVQCGGLSREEAWEKTV